jgi:hypothetical protein
MKAKKNKRSKHSEEEEKKVDESIDSSFRSSRSSKSLRSSKKLRISFSQAQRKYLSVLDEDLRECIDEGQTLPITGNKCASACVLGDITVIDQRGAKVGCYASSTFAELFMKDYFAGSHE